MFAPILLVEHIEEVKRTLLQNLGTDEMAEEIMSIDPTPGKGYSNWITKMYIFDREKFELLYDLIPEYYELIRRKKIKQPYADIYRISDIDQLSDVIGDSKSSIETKSRSYTNYGKSEIMTRETEWIHKGKNVMVFVPKTHRSWCYWFPDRWCITHQNDLSKSTYMSYVDTHGFKCIALVDKSKPEEDHKKYVCITNYNMQLQIPRGDAFRDYVEMVRKLNQQQGWSEEEIGGHFDTYDFSHDLDSMSFEISFADNKHSRIANSPEMVAEILQPYYDEEIKPEWFK